MTPPTLPPVHGPEPTPAPQPTYLQLFNALWPPVVLGLMLMALYAYTRAGLPEYRQFLMPSADGLWENAFSRPDVLQELWQRALVTMSIALMGLGVSIPFGIIIGVIMFRLHFMERAVFPFLVALQSIPVLAIIPLIQSALGFGILPKVLIVAIFTFFSVPTTLLLGLKSLDRGIVDLFRMAQAPWHVTLLKAGLPSSAPALFAGFRISAGLAVIGAIVSELFFISGEGGLGQMLINAKIDFKYEQMYAALITSSVLSIATFLGFQFLGNKLFSAWHGRV